MVRAVNAYQAQRIRFGILAARHIYDREAMTPGQVDYLEGCEANGWMIGDGGTVKAFEREASEILSRRALKAHGKRAAELRKRWMADG
jgi:putative IMPACT (imprinted ancient) family translation regulator